MNVLTEGELTFTFPSAWDVTKYDDWSFYRHQFSQMREGLKAVDFIGWDAKRRWLWLIEVKDYREHRRTKVLDLATEVSQKVCDTLAALLPAKVNGNDAPEQRLAGKALSAVKLRVVLHLEQPSRRSTLRPHGAIDPASVTMKLRRLVRAIDPHPIVCHREGMQGLPWTAA